MQQVTQRVRDGRVEVLDVPAPAVTPDGVLVDVRASLLSAGTERTKIQTGRQSLIGKARSRPDQVQKVLEKAQRDGVRATVQGVRSRLNQPTGLGYSAAGVVLAVGERVTDLIPGDRVACGGEGYAVHAELAVVPGNLCVRVPPGVGLDAAAFATVGAIALHGVHQADVRLGERVGVIGLGLVGQLTGRLLRASGCTVVGVDLSAELVQRAHAGGAADLAYERSKLSETLPEAASECDAAIITAGTASADPVRLAAQMCRDRGRVVVVGAVAMDLPRPPYYGKELELRLSRSYGPGRYDRAYEERGLDYPIGYVRWTERRNMGAILDLVENGRLEVADLITQRLPVEEAARAYERLLGDDVSPVGILLEYQETTLPGESAAPAPPAVHASGSPPAVGLLGAGSFAQGTIVPALARAGFALAGVASATGRTAHAAKEQFGFARAARTEELLGDPNIDLIAVATRHASHAELTIAGLEASKAVFVEKPPCLTADELDRVRTALTAAARPLLVGFNRRHAPLARQLREGVRRPGMPFELLFRVNAGRLPADHWLNDPEDGGGRLLGEGCHFVDFACWFAGALPVRVSCTLRPEGGQPLAAAQSFSVALDFADGSLATVVYGARGASGLAKEYVEAHSGGRSGVLNDFRSLTLFDGRKRRVTRGRSSDKGHGAQFAHLRALVAGEGEPESPSGLDTMGVTLAALRAAATGAAVSTDAFQST
jgi:predicted dehydrogenase/threonine dehydrogenase-like Zn-dependent dehydrogenase